MSADASRGPQVDERSRRAPTWPRAAVVAALLVLTVVVAKTCQKSEIQVSEQEALVLAREQVRFEPEHTQIRLLRQGIQRHPYWIISLSIGDLETQVFEELAVVRIDATSGEVVEVRDQRVDEQEDSGEESGPRDGGPNDGGGGA